MNSTSHISSEQELAHYFDREFTFLDGPLYEMKSRKGLPGSLLLWLTVGFELFLLITIYCLLTLNLLFATLLEVAKLSANVIHHGLKREHARGTPHHLGG